ncbi:MAG TPA: methylenetetrahydrofolate reductase [NAD(P)H] [Candidatus Bathyarchaeia archaeon]|nr:methylenetetrahydrofolate reductase [NAD(P)H] [Candidatus Bathyarchaeia archaeon]
MKKLTEIFKEKTRTFSFELFPPKTEQGYENLLQTIGQLAQLKPDFISCTYGAGGGNRDKTFDIAQYIQEKHGIPSVAHLTCVLNTKNQINEILNDVKARGIKNILALRGDPPQNQPDWKPGPENFKYSYELCDFIRAHFNGTFAIGVAGFPQGHILCRDLEKDALFLKNKLEHGGDFVVTQLFLDNDFYFDYIKRLANIGVTTRVIPGILPIVNYNRLPEFSTRDGISIPEKVKAIFEPIKDDPEKTLEAGKRYAIEQCQDLLKRGAPGIHFYALNKYQPVADILMAIR